MEDHFDYLNNGNGNIDDFPSVNDVVEEVVSTYNHGTLSANENSNHEDSDYHPSKSSESAESESSSDDDVESGAESIPKSVPTKRIPKHVQNNSSTGRVKPTSVKGKEKQKDGPLLKKRKTNGPPPLLRVLPSTEIANLENNIKKSPLFDGKYFHFVSLEKIVKNGKYTEKITSRCAKCSVLISVTNSSRTNLTRHMKRKHGFDFTEEYKNYKDQKRKNKKAQRCNDNTETVSSESTPPSAPSATSNSNSTTIEKNTTPVHQDPGQLKLEDFNIHPVSNNQTYDEDDDPNMTQYGRLKRIKDKQKLLNHGFVRFVTNGCHAFSIVDEKDFKKLIQIANPNLNVYSHQTLMKEINISYETSVKFYRNIAEKYPYLSLTCDIWSTANQKKSFMGVTMHWIDDKLERASAAIACEKMSGRHDYANIAETIGQVLARFNITPSKVSAITTDNASNFVKAFKEFGLQNVYYAEREDCEFDEIIEIDLENECSECLTFDDEVLRDGNSRASRVLNLPPHFRCGCHTLNLIASADYPKFINDKKNDLKTIHDSLMNKCNKIWKGSRQYLAYQTLFKILRRNIPYPCITRWNSLYKALEFFVKNNAKMPDVLECVGEEEFTVLEKDYLDAYVKAVKPIADSLEIFENEERLYGSFLPTLFATEVTLSELASSSELNMDTEHEESVVVIANELKTNFETRFRKFLSLKNETEVNMAVLATLTHPKYKLTCFNEDEEEKFKRLLISSVEKDWNDVQQNAESEEQNVQQEVSEQDLFISKCRRRRGENAEIANASLTSTRDDDNRFEELTKRQINKYFEDKRVQLRMLDDYPAVKKVFLKTNVVLSSSASVERLFSIAKLILNNRRGSMLDSNFEKTLILRSFFTNHKPDW